MRVNFIHSKSIAQLTVLALIAVCLLQPPACAHPAGINTVAAQDPHIDLYKNVWINQGLARGQKLRYTWANLNDPDPLKCEFEPLRIRVKLLAADGSVIAQAEAAAVGAGQFQSFDFNRDLISLPGEAGTGRLQARLEVTVSGIHRITDITLKRGVIGTFEDTVEVIDTLTGGTTVGFSGGMNKLILDDSLGNEYLAPKTFQIISAGKDYLIGIVPGQTLLVSVLNPLAPPPPGADGRKYKMLFAPLILNADGQVIAQSDEVALDPGEFHSFDFKRADLPLAGAPGADRAQVRVEIRRRFFPGIPSRISQGELDGAPAAVEIFNDSTGKTTTLISQKPKEIVVVGSK
jgi:hypothetical protein